jgi:hypothetical protein
VVWGKKAPQGLIGVVVEGVVVVPVVEVPVVVGGGKNADQGLKAGAGVVVVGVVVEGVVVFVVGVVVVVVGVVVVGGIIKAAHGLNGCCVVPVPVVVG